MPGDLRTFGTTTARSTSSASRPTCVRPPHLQGRRKARHDSPVLLVLAASPIPARIFSRGQLEYILVGLLFICILSTGSSSDSRVQAEAGQAGYLASTSPSPGGRRAARFSPRLSCYCTGSCFVAVPVALPFLGALESGSPASRPLEWQQGVGPRPLFALPIAPPPPPPPERTTSPHCRNHTPPAYQTRDAPENPKSSTRVGLHERA